MKKLTKILTESYYLRYFILPLFLVWTSGVVFLLFKGYNESFLILNGFNASSFDMPMFGLTLIADAGFMACLLIFLMIKKQPYQLIMLLITIIVSGIAAQLFKNFVFSDWHRPPYMFKEQIHTVGSYILNHHSFPSGHSTTIAAIFTLLAYFRRQYKLEILLYAILCPVIAFTRIYLGVHFLGDVLAGLALGVLCSLLLLWLIKPFELKSKPWVVIVLKIASVVVAAIMLADFFGKYL